MKKEIKSQDRILSANNFSLLGNAKYLKNLISEAEIKLRQQKMTILIDLTKTTKKAFSKLCQFFLYMVNHHPNALEFVALSTQFTTGLARNMIYFYRYDDFNNKNSFVWNTDQSNDTALSILGNCSARLLDPKDITNPIQAIIGFCSSSNDTMSILNGSSSSASHDPVIDCIRDKMCSPTDPVASIGIILGVLGGLALLGLLCCQWLCGKKEHPSGYIIIKQERSSNCLVM